MSITVGGRLHAPWVILLGGTGSGSELACRRVYGGESGIESIASALFPSAMPRPHPFIQDWPGGLPVTTPAGTVNPRRRGLIDLEATLRAIHEREVRRVGLIGFSHGGWIAMRAADAMLRTTGWKGADIRLVTLSTPPLTDNLATARRLGQHVVGGSLRWLGLREPDDPVDPGLSGIMEPMLSGDGRYGQEGLFKLVQTEARGIAAHDTFPSSPEVRETIRTWAGV